MLEDLIRRAGSLNEAYQLHFITWLNTHLETVDNQTSTSVLEIHEESINENGLTCPHCKSTEFIGHGTYKDRKRYECKQCKRSFTELTGTSINKIHLKDKWDQYLSCMIEGLSLRASAKKAIK